MLQHVPNRSDWSQQRAQASARPESPRLLRPAGVRSLAGVYQYARSRATAAIRASSQALQTSIANAQRCRPRCRGTLKYSCGPAPKTSPKRALGLNLTLPCAIALSNFHAQWFDRRAPLVGTFPVHPICLRGRVGSVRKHAAVFAEAKQRSLAPLLVSVISRLQELHACRTALAATAARRVAHIYVR